MDVPELLSIPPPTQQLEDVHAPFVFEILLICFNDTDCIDYYLFQNEKKWKRKMLPPTLDPRQKDRLSNPPGGLFFQALLRRGGGGGA